MTYNPKNFDRTIHSSYIKTCSWLGLTEQTNVERDYKGKDVIYYYDSYYFTVNDTIRVYDWTLSPSETDKMFQYANATLKKKEQLIREAKKLMNSNNKIMYSNTK